MRVKGPLRRTGNIRCMHNFTQNTCVDILQTNTKYVVNVRVDDDEAQQAESTAATTTESSTNENSLKETPSYFAIIMKASLAVGIGECGVFSRNYSTISILRIAQA